MKSVADAGMTIVEIGPNEPTLEGGVVAIDRIIAAGVTAVVAYNDLMAIGLLREAVSRGIMIPGQLSIIGFDNIFGSDFTTPPLTTIQMPLDKVGGDAVRSLLLALSEISSEVQAEHRSTLQTHLVLRGSTSKPVVN